MTHAPERGGRDTLRPLPARWCPPPTAGLPTLDRRQSASRGAAGKRNSKGEGHRFLFQRRLPGPSTRTKFGGPPSPGSGPARMGSPTPAGPGPLACLDAPTVRSWPPSRRCESGTRARWPGLGWAGLGLRAPPHRPNPVGRGLVAPPGGAGVHPGVPPASARVRQLRARLPRPPT